MTEREQNAALHYLKQLVENDGEGPVCLNDDGQPECFYCNAPATWIVDDLAWSIAHQKDCPYVDARAFLRYLELESSP